MLVSGPSDRLHYFLFYGRMSHRYRVWIRYTGTTCVLVFLLVELTHQALRRYPPKDFGVLHQQPLRLPNAYVITFPDAARRAHVHDLQASFEALKIQIWQAVTPEMIHSPRFAQYVKNSYGVRVGAIGCALAHATLLEHFISTDETELLVFEDDAVLHADFETEFMLFRDQLPSDYEFCHLLHHKDMKSLRTKAKYNMKSEYVMRSYAPYATVGYLVNRQGAEKILSSIKPLTEPIDEVIRKLLNEQKMIGYMPTKDLVTNPYVLPSNIWNTTKLSAVCHNFPFKWEASLLRETVDLLHAVHVMLEDIKVEYVIAYSTALGFARHDGHFIPWDDDVDIMIRPSDTQRVVRRIQQDPTHCVAAFWGGPKVFRCDSPKIGNYDWSYPFVDIFNDTSKVIQNVLWPSSLTQFEGITVRIPKHPTKYLDIEYGNSWSTECVALSWAHSSESRTHHGAVRVNCESLQNQCGNMWPSEMAPRTPDIESTKKHSFRFYIIAALSIFLAVKAKKRRKTKHTACRIASSFGNRRQSSIRRP